MSKLYTAAQSLPSRAFTGFTGLGGIAASLYPEKIKDRIDAAMSVGDIRLIALGITVFAALYWLWLSWLKPSNDTLSAPTLAQSTSGASSPILNGPIHGSVTFNSVLQDEKWDRLTQSAKAAAVRQQNIEAARAQIVLVPQYKTWDDQQVRRDKALNDGIFYAASGAWRHSSLSDQPSYFAEMGSLLTEFHQLARDSELSAWGKVERSGVYEPLDPSVWSEGAVDYLDLLRPGDTPMKRLDGNGIMFADIMISQAEFERKWPRAR
ncbi:hypothetical protein [Sphingomonas bacterium]|uniref:hypothetical protein n=1 Tax=Sphingomonas bacterium TaxID=1895847 RepID=UPI0015764C1D|nr:hypothetical protein [Sphingomonas bacterium]